MKYKTWGLITSVSAGAAALAALSAAYAGIVSMQVFAFILLPFTMLIEVRLTIDRSMREIEQGVRRRGAPLPPAGQR